MNSRTSEPNYKLNWVFQNSLRRASYFKFRAQRRQRVRGRGIVDRTAKSFIMLQCQLLQTIVHHREQLKWVGALVLWLWEETHVLKVANSYPCTVYWMDNVSHLFVVKLAMFVQNDENK